AWNLHPKKPCVNPLGNRADSAAAGPRAAAPRGMLKQRLLTVAVVLPLLLGCIFLLPNPGWALLMTVPTALGAFEWAKLAGYGPGARRLFVGAVLASCLLLIAIS